MTSEERHAIRYLRRNVESGEARVAYLRKRNLLAAVPELERIAGRIAALRVELDQAEASQERADSMLVGNRESLRELLRLFGCDLRAHWATLGAQVKRACGED